MRLAVAVAAVMMLPAAASGAPPVHAQTRQLVAPQRAPGDQFGATIVAEGDLAVIAAPGRVVGFNNNAGVIYTLARQAEVWTVTATFDETGSSMSGRVMGRAMAMRGDLLVLGAPGHYFDRGLAYLYQYDMMLGWKLQSGLEDPMTPVGGRFGTSVALALAPGVDQALVGETVETLPPADAVTGKVHVFDRTTGWKLTQTFLPQDLESGDRFGYAIAADGEVAVIGAPGKEGGRGAAYVFTRAGGLWSQADKLVIASDRVPGDFFGAAVAIAGERMIVGAFGRAGGQGAAFVFERADEGWVQVQALTADAPAEMEQFGKRVALRGDRAVVSGQGFEQAPMVGSRGGAYLFSHDAVDEGEAQSEHFRLLAALRADDGVPGDTLGVGVALTDREVFLGAPFDDAPAQPAPDLSKAPGSAYLFGLTQVSGEPCGRDEDCGAVARCCDHACAAFHGCESATTGGPGSSSGGETPTTGAATTDGSTSTGPGAVPEAQFEPGDAGCACDADNRRGAPIEIAGLLVLTVALRRRRGTHPTS